MSLANYKPTPEEQKAINDCNREAIYYRAIPTSIGLGASVWYAVSLGILRANPKYGALPKVALAAAGGYFMGFASYMPVCARKFLMLPNSPLVATIKQRAGWLQTDSEAGRGSSSEQTQTNEGEHFGSVEAPKSSTMFERLPSEEPGIEGRKEEDPRMYLHKNF